MTIQRHNAKFETLSADVLSQWRTIPPAIVSDMMNRTQCMSGRMKALKTGTVLVGQARTVTCMVGDNAALHALVPLIQPGEIIVADGGGHEDVALWGGILTQAAMAQKTGGIVIDGGVRDVAEIIELGFPCYSTSRVPQGPHKGFGGIIDGTISCAGAHVSPGDIIIGDDDGIAVVPLARHEELLAASIQKLADENATVARIKAGETTAQMMGLPDPEMLP